MSFRFSHLADAASLRACGKSVAVLQLTSPIRSFNLAIWRQIQTKFSLRGVRTIETRDNSDLRCIFRRTRSFKLVDIGRFQAGLSWRFSLEVAARGIAICRCTRTNARFAATYSRNHRMYPNDRAFFGRPGPLSGKTSVNCASGLQWPRHDPPVVRRPRRMSARTRRDIR